AHRFSLRAGLAIALQLDRQAVAVPDGNVRRVEAKHVVRLDDEVLENLVERVTHVDLAVCVRRTVVQQVLRGALAGRANLAIEVHRVPAGHGFRLGCLQVRLHREGGPWQVARVFPLGPISLLYAEVVGSQGLRVLEEVAASMVKETVLGNGLKVLIQEVHTAPLASVWCWYRVGSKDEGQGVTGVSHWCEHMNFKGTKNIPRDQVKGIIEKFGGAWNGYTWIDQTTYLETASKDALDRMLF